MSRPLRPRRVLPLALALVSLALAPSCRSTPELPPGQGLLTVDSAPPSFVELFEAPRWSAGDQLEYQRGGVQRLRQLVAEHPDGWGLVNVESRHTLVLDENFGQFGEVDAKGESVVVLDPVDPSLHFPLWVGKRWSAEFVRRSPDSPDIPLLVHYHADALETLELPIGRVRALRIWRRLSLAREGSFYDRTSLQWYAPDLGFVVRRLEDGVLLDLVGIERSGGTGPASTPDAASEAP
jgi:hypothetical protein